MPRNSHAAELAELQAVDERLQAEGDPRAQRCLARRNAGEAAPKRPRVRSDWRQELREEYLDARDTKCQHCLTSNAQAPRPPSPGLAPICRVSPLLA